MQDSIFEVEGSIELRLYGGHFTVCGEFGCVEVTVDGCSVEVDILGMAVVEGELGNFCAFEADVGVEGAGHEV